MRKKNPGNFLTPAVILFILGLIVISAGIYFELNSLTTSGITLHRRGGHGSATIDGKGMIFCGIIIGGFALIIRHKKSEEQDS